jgi:hypothetical protein
MTYTLRATYFPGASATAIQEDDIRALMQLFLTRKQDQFARIPDSRIPGSIAIVGKAQHGIKIRSDHVKLRSEHYLAGKLLSPGPRFGQSCQYNQAVL